MNKYLIKGMTLLAVCAGFASCSKDLTPMSQEEIDNLQALKVTNTYEQAFLNYVGGSIAEDLDWGFSDVYGTAKTRSQSSPEVLGISAPYNATQVADYLATASEPTTANISNNDAGASLSVTQVVVWPQFQNGLYCGYCDWYQYNQDKVNENDLSFYNNTFTPLLAAYNNAAVEDSYYNNVINYVTVNNAKIDKFYDLYNAVVAYAGESGLVNWLSITTMPTRPTYSSGDFVLNFKITGEWTGGIGVVATEGYTDGVANGNERTVVVTGKWNLTENQRVGSKGRIIIADGGELAISSGATLEMVNQSRLVLLGTGKITGAGNISVTNGNAAGFENYIDADAQINITGTFNNNFGKLYNYGTFKAGTYAAGGSGDLDNGASCFYNHGLVVIDNGGVPGTYVSTNARIFNNCQWYCKNDMRAYILELAGGSSFLVDGELEMSTGNDGSSDPTYVAMASGALLRCGTLRNNGTSWTGPTSGNYAVLSAGQVTYLNWQQKTYPLTAGYIENNIYIQVDDMTNNPDGNNVWVEGVTMNAEWKLKNIVANGLDGGTTGRGNGNTKVIGTGSTQIITSDNNFVKGQSGCTPGFTGDITTPTPPPSEEEEEEEDPGTPSIRIIAEDLNANGTDKSDFDFNDVVIDVYYGDAGKAKAKIVAAGGTLQLKVDGHEVHELFGEKNNANYTGMMINTNGTLSSSAGVSSRSVDGAKCPIITLSKAVNSAAEARDNIKIEVNKGGWIELQAKRGTPAAKVGVSPKYEYCNERQEINGRYPKFKEWVQSGNDMFWWE